MSDQINEIEQVSLSIKRGDTKRYTVYFRDEAGSLVDITGWTVFFTVKENITDTDPNAKISKTITDHSDPTNGESTIELTSVDTNLDGNYLFDIQIKRASGDINTILEGMIVFTKDVTQRTS